MTVKISIDSDNESWLRSETIFEGKVREDAIKEKMEEAEESTPKKVAKRYLSKLAKA